MSLFSERTKPVLSANTLYGVHRRNHLILVRLGWIIVVIALIIVGYALYIFAYDKRPVKQPLPFLTNKSSTSPPALTSSGIILLNNDSITPQTIRLTKGGSVTWRNESTHSQLIRSDLVVEFGDIELQPNDTYTYTFNEFGTYTYYLEASPSTYGTVIVSAD